MQADHTTEQKIERRKGYMDTDMCKEEHCKTLIELEVRHKSAIATR